MVSRETHQGLTLKQLAASSPSALPLADEVSFEFRKQTFVFSQELQRFEKLPYPSKDTFGNYGKNTGYGSEAKAQAAANKWGRNMWVIKIAVFLNRMLYLVYLLCSI